MRHNPRMLHDPHYLHSIVTLGERHPVIAHRPITTVNGIKLVDSGVRLSAALYDKLVRHKLLPEIDECLSIADPVTPAALAAAAQALLDEGGLAGQLARHIETAAVGRVFAALPLAPALAFKLTLAREQRPRLFRHSLQVALCAVILAMQHPGASDQGLIQAAAAGLFHDLGLLHVDPEVVDRPGALSEQERHHIYSHPVAGHLILSRFPEWHPIVSAAVLEHHERLDASGYPRGLGGDDISPLGQLLAVAELAASMFFGQRSIPLADSVHVVLRLNQGKINRDIADLLTSLALDGPHNAAPDAGGVDYSAVLGRLVGLSMAIQHWHQLAGQFADQPIAALIGRRLERLEHNLAGIGIDLQYWVMIDNDLAADTASLHELATGVEEARWQLRAIAQEARRDWERLQPKHPRARQEIHAWIARVEEDEASGTPA